MPSAEVEREQLDELKLLLQRYPELAPEQHLRLKQLFGDLRAAEFMVLLRDPTIFDALRDLDPPVTLAWGRALTCIAGMWAVAMGLWLWMR